MSKLVIRHGLSGANDKERYGTPAFGNPQASLMHAGVEQATQLGEFLTEKFGIVVQDEPVAVSEMLRTQETAIFAGFRILTIYPELNEEKGGLSDAAVRKALNTRHSPEAVIRAARLIIENPPTENVLITHAFVIATICKELGVYGSLRFHPKFCEVRELPL